MLAGDPDAPNILDGAVLAATIGEYAGHLETDGIGARSGPVLHVTELKGWPKVDGKADDAGKMGEAKRQMGVYAYLLAGLVGYLGGDPGEVVGRDGLLVTPRNVGLTLEGTRVPLQQKLRRAELLLARVARPGRLRRPSANAGGVRARGRPVAAPGAAGNQFSALADELGTHYQESCLTSCALNRLCRELRGQAGDVTLCGSSMVRYLPGIRTLDRAAALADGEAPTAEEAASGVAGQVALAGDLYRRKFSPGPDRAATAATAPPSPAGRP